MVLESCHEFIEEKFKLSTEVVYTGLDTKQSFMLINVSQFGYIEHISEIKIDSARAKLNDVPINEIEKKQLRSGAGQLLLKQGLTLAMERVLLQIRTYLELYVI